MLHLCATCVLQRSYISTPHLCANYIYSVTSSSLCYISVPRASLLCMCKRAIPLLACKHRQHRALRNCLPSVFSAMAVCGRKTRLVACADISVSEIMTALDKFMLVKGNRDLSGLLRASKVSWKSAPTAVSLQAVSELFMALSAVAPNTALPNRLTSLALEKLHGLRPCNFTSKTVSDWANETSAHVRCLFSKFRQLAYSPTARQTCFKKARRGDRSIIQTHVFARTR